VVTADDIFYDESASPTTTILDRPWFLRPGDMAKDLFFETFTRIACRLLTGMYKDMSKEMNNPNGGGGEFLAAIQAAEKCPTCTRLVLGDRDSLTTIKRAAQLALESGDPMGVLSRLEQVNAQEMTQLEERVRKQLLQEKKSAAANSNDDNNEDVLLLDNSQVKIAMTENMKADEQF
jgi:hypothetical protein